MEKQTDLIDNILEKLLEDMELDDYHFIVKFGVPKQEIPVQ